ncbi:MAG: RelA/SpoT family protein [Fusobacteriaceae bacterium]
MDYWQQIEDKIKNNNLNVDLLKIKNALLLAEESHIGQYRKSGEDYILHPVEVTNILIDMKMDTDTIVAGILHDIVEDTLITLADIKYNFGDSVSELVDGVTKLKNLPNGTKNQYENIRKMILAMSKNLSVVIIKLADRLHNMRTLKYMKPEKQISIAKETLEIYAPLAHRLGLAKIKWELEDLALNYLHPVEYQELKRLIDTKKVERETYIENLVKELNKIVVEDANLDIDITGRVKHFYSIYKKMYEKGKDFDALYDLIGVRIITKNKTECYHVLGIIQDKYQPVPGRFKDYISAPKSNNYQSIHTTVIGPGGKFVEIQIRTEEMHKIAEEGIAAHWSYKEKVAVNKNDEVYGWLRGVIETQQNENSEEFVKSFTEELIKESVFVFSPKGDVVELAMGATPLDFAFNIHTDIGCKCIGSKVNGKIVPLEYKLKNGDRVDIITSKNAKGPGNDWLNIVVTSGAKNKIRKWLKEQNFEENIKLGKELLENELSKLGMTLKEFEESSILKKHIEKHNIGNLEDFYFQLAEKRSKIDVVITKLKAKLEKEREEKERIENPLTVVEKKIREKTAKKNDYGIVIDGINNTLLKFAKCCTPLPGDEVGGYVTKLTGITIHRKNCLNYQNMILNDKGREIEVNWDPKLLEKRINKYKFSFSIFVNNRNNIIADIVALISNHKINLISINSTELKRDGHAVAKVRLTVELTSKVEYKQLTSNIQKIKDVLSIER